MNVNFDFIIALDLTHCNENKCTLTASSSPEQAVTRVRILRHFNVATAAISHWCVSEIDTQLKNQKQKHKNKKRN